MPTTDKSVEEIATELAEVNNNMLAVQQEITAQVAQFQNELNGYQERDKELRAAMKAAMEATGGKPYEDDNIKVIYVKPTTRVGVDAVKLQLEQPDVYEQYKKVTNVSGSVRIKVK